jgi:hypothetical protein
MSYGSSTTHTTLRWSLVYLLLAALAMIALGGAAMAALAG